MVETEMQPAKKRDGLFIPRREASSITVVLIMLGFILFAAGYYWGHKTALRGFSDQVESETLNDRIALSLGTLDSDGQSKDDLDDDVTTPDTQPAATESQVATSSSASTTHPAPIQAKKEAIITAKPGTKYIARIIGYGYLKPAKRFADKLTRQGIPVKVEKRTTITKKGKKRIWYQVKTHPYKNKVELQDIVNTIARREHITGIAIVSI
jgi:hypothetical protein